MLSILLSNAVISLASIACSAASKKLLDAFSSAVLFEVGPLWFCAGLLLAVPVAEFRVVVLFVPATCLKGQSSVRHSLAMRD